MHYRKNELILLYNERNEKDKKTLAYAYTITNEINKQEINTVRFSDTLFRMMLEKLKLTGKQIINKADPFYQEHCRGKDISIEDWYAVLKNKPSLLRSPIALYKNQVLICETPTDILRLSA